MGNTWSALTAGHYMVSSCWSYTWVRQIWEINVNLLLEVMSHIRHLFGVFCSSSGWTPSWWEGLRTVYRVRTCSVISPEWCYWQPLHWNSSPGLVKMVSLSGIIEVELLIGFFCVSVSVHVLNWRNTNEIQILFEVGSLFLTFCRLLMHVHVFPWILKQSKYHFGREFWYNFPPKKGKLSLWNFFFHVTVIFCFSFLQRLWILPADQ